MVKIERLITAVTDLKEFQRFERRPLVKKHGVVEFKTQRVNWSSPAENNVLEINVYLFLIYKHFIFNKELFYSE